MIDLSAHAFQYLTGFEFIPESLVEHEAGDLFMAKRNHIRYLIVHGEIAQRFEGEDIGEARVCPLNKRNSRTLRSILPEYNPVPMNRSGASFGFGDRLGVATCGQLKAVARTNIQPVIAQQSVRELRQTGRTFEDVLADAVWGAFQAGYHGAFVADGDHLKNGEEIEKALAAGYSMITLDCSEKLQADAHTLTRAEKLQKFNDLPARVVMNMRASYLDKVLPTGPVSEEELAECVLAYSDVIDFVDFVYNRYLSTRSNISFELSIDETIWPTTYFAHYFLANELIKVRGIRIDSIAPRFVGDFQKAIDYIGDVAKFEQNLQRHHEIASEWGYKISIHSGSDKFSIYPSIARVTGHKYHIKTSGTSWLEFFRLVANKEPDLFRELYQFSLEHLDDAKKLYTISTTRHICPDIEVHACERYQDLMANESVRQLLHVNYGAILAYQQDGITLYRNRLFELLNQEEAGYHQIVQAHFEQHLRALGEYM